jgi:1-acyl-sn-glycerol-3-phosphate acyltransferase
VKSNPIKYPHPLAVRAAQWFTLVSSKLLWFITYRNKHNIPQDLKSGLLIAPNHQTYFDPFWVCVPVHRKMRFMAWADSFDWFLIGPMIRYLGSFPVTYDLGGTKNAMKEALRSLRDGATLIIFPEGGREFPNGEMLEFKHGAVRIAMQAGVPILPVTIRGAHHVWTRTMKKPRFFKRVEIIYHPLFEVPEPPEGVDMREHLDDLTARLKTIIASAM